MGGPAFFATAATATLCLLCTVLAEQVILGPTVVHVAQGISAKDGSLRRFVVDNGRDKELLLGAVEEYNLDLWHMTETFADIYFNGEAPPLPEAIRQLSHSYPFNLSSQTPTAKPESSVSTWNLDSIDNTTFHADYHPLSEISQFIHAIPEQYPDIATVIHYGHSGEGREMIGLKISKPVEGNTSVTRHTARTDKPGIVIVGAQHSREWVGISTSLYLAHALVSNETNDGSLRFLLESFDFYIVPVPNPDGYVYTWESDRFWYKNRQMIGPNAKCVGLDMNRNWGYKWKRHPTDARTHVIKKPPKKSPTPTDPCHHWFPGHRAFEAPEVNNLANWITTLPNLIGFLNLRSYGQMLSAPYSYSCTATPKDAEDQLEAAMGAANALRTVHGTSFVTGTLCGNLYRAPGNMIDYMYAKAGIKYTFTAHLRDTGTYGFSLPAEWIRPVGEETAKMAEYLARFILQHDKKTFG